MEDLDARWRDRIAKRCGGASFDAPGGGYSFSEVLAEERELVRLNKPRDPTSALLILSRRRPIRKDVSRGLECSQ